MKKYVLLLLSTVLITTSCKKPFNGGDPCADVNCTADFREIRVYVVGSDKKPVMMDEFYTVRVGTDDTLYHTSTALVIYPYKVVLDDSYLTGFKNKRDAFRFIGFYKNKLVVDEPYTLSADCCHVKKDLGADSVLSR